VCYENKTKLGTQLLGYYSIKLNKLLRVFIFFCFAKQRITLVDLQHTMKERTLRVQFSFPKKCYKSECANTNFHKKLQEPLCVVYLMPIVYKQYAGNDKLYLS